jgi:zinc-ribbon domain
MTLFFKRADGVREGALQETMYCPQCATQNIDRARFCRSCGANVSLVPQALSGHLPESQSDKIERAIKGAIKRRREPNLARGLRKTSIGIAFLMAVAVLFFTRHSVGFGAIWLLIPAFMLLGKGIAEVVTVISEGRGAKQLAATPAALHTNQLPLQSNYDSLAPPSVTEGTTRHLDTAPEKQRETS